MNQTENTTATAAEKLTNFLREVEKDGIMPTSQMNMIRFAIKNEQEAALEDFLEWLYEGQENPSKEALKALNQGKYKYFDHFPTHHGANGDDLEVIVKYYDSDLNEDGEVITENLDHEDAIMDAVYKNYPDWEWTGFAIYRDQITTDFRNDGDWGSNPTIFTANFKYVRVYEIEVETTPENEMEEVNGVACDLIDSVSPAGCDHTEVCVQWDGYRAIVTEGTDPDNPGEVLMYVVVTRKYKNQ